MAEESSQRTALFEKHSELGAKLAPFAGWEMPISYAGIREEHAAVRENAGVFDTSHMGQIETSGPAALEFLQRLLSNDVAKLAVGDAQYALICNDDGGVLDDVISYRLADDRYLTVTNAANHARDLDWFIAHSDGYDVAIADRIEDFAMLAVQGPKARALLQPLCDEPLPKRMTAAQRSIAGVPDVLVCGTGYTGEDGVELLLAPEHAGAVWDAVTAAGAEPAGLGARDTLRIEACFPLYGQDLTETRGPIEARLGWACKEQTGFIGADRIARDREQGTAESLVAFAITGAGIARAGNPISGGGEVTSGTLSLTLGYGIGLAYLPSENAVIGTELEIDVRGRLRAAEVRSKPLVGGD